MAIIKENKYLIMGCITLIMITLAIVWFSQKRSDAEGGYEFTEDNYLKNYAVNEVIPVVVDDELMARTYLAEYVTLMINDPKEAYALLDPDYQTKAYPTFQDFTKYVDQIKTALFYQAALLKYEVSVEAGYKIFNLYDQAGNNYIFKESSVMNYTVLLDSYTI